MAEYIERGALLDTLRRNLRAAERGSVCFDCVMSAVETVEAAPAADVVEARHGKPRPSYDFFEDYDGAHIHRIQAGWKCPFCGIEVTGNYCPNCGAKMDGEEYNNG